MTVENPAPVEIPEYWEDMDGNEMRSLAADLSDDPIKSKADAIRAIIAELNRRAEEAPDEGPAAETPTEAPVTTEVTDAPEAAEVVVSPVRPLSAKTVAEQEAGRRALNKRKRL